MRELRNVYERVSVLFPGKLVSRNELRMCMQLVDNQSEPTSCEMESSNSSILDVDDLRSLLKKEKSLNIRYALRDIEESLIEAALDMTGGCISHAADALKLKRTTLAEKMKKLNITSGARVRT